MATQTGSYDFKAGKDAATKATDYITDVTDGIFVAPEGQGPNDTNTPTGWKITDVLEYLKAGVSAFKVWIESGMAKLRLGESSKSHVELDYHSLQMVDIEGSPYLHVSDMRDGNGSVTVTEVFAYEDAEYRQDTDMTSLYRFYLSVTPESTDYSVTVNDNAVTPKYKLTSYFELSGITAVMPGDEIKVVYQYSGDIAKAFTFGHRGDGVVAPMSVVLGEGIAKGAYSYAGGKGSVAFGSYSHAQNLGTFANGASQTVIGRYNKADSNNSSSRKSNTYAVIIGNGTSDNARKDALTVDWKGNVSCGAVNYATCPTSDGSSTTYTKKKAYVTGATSSAPSNNGFNLLVGAVVRVKFTYAQTYKAALYLNVNGTGDVAIYVNNAATSSTNPLKWLANTTMEFYYDGTYWVYTGNCTGSSRQSNITEFYYPALTASTAPAESAVPVLPCKVLCGDGAEFLFSGL